MKHLGVEVANLLIVNLRNRKLTSLDLVTFQNCKMFTRKKSAIFQLDEANYGKSTAGAVFYTFLW